MKARIVIAAALALALAQIGAADKTRVSRASIAAMETSIDKRLTRLWPDDPFLLLGTTRGVYLEGYGAVFTAEVNLATAPGISPFHPSVSKDDIARHRQKKLERLPQLRGAMRDLLVASAGSLDAVPPEEQISLGVSLSRYPWEDATGIPTQILMQGRKGKLLEAQRLGKAQVEAVIKTQDY